MGQHHHRLGRIATIVDGDNIAHGGKDEPSQVKVVLDWLAGLTRGWPVTFAIKRDLAKVYLPTYAARPWEIRFASTEPDAADKELLEAAEYYATHECNGLFVVSGDHAFADLAGLAPLHVASYRDSLSKRLELAASSVTYLDDLFPAAA